MQEEGVWINKDRILQLGDWVMLKLLLAFLDDQSGVAHLEYALVVALVTMGLLGSIQTMGTSVSEFFLAASNQFGDAVIVDVTGGCEIHNYDACDQNS